MGQHKLNLSEEDRAQERKRFNALKRIEMPKGVFLKRPTQPGRNVRRAAALEAIMSKRTAMAENKAILERKDN